MPEDLKLEEPTETDEQLDEGIRRLSKFVRQDGSVVSMGKQELGLLQKVLSTGEETYKDEHWWRMCSFKDEEEAYDHVNAYNEAKDLGMDTRWNVDYAFALCSTNRKGGFFNNLVAILTDTLQHAKWANANRPRTGEGDNNPRSPLRQ